MTCILTGPRASIASHAIGDESSFHVCEADHSPPFSAMSLMLAAITQL
jgi:hypothetical protein